MSIFHIVVIISYFPSIFSRFVQDILILILKKRRYAMHTIYKVSKNNLSL